MVELLLAPLTELADNLRWLIVTMFFGDRSECEFTFQLNIEHQKVVFEIGSQFVTRRIFDRIRKPVKIWKKPENTLFTGFQ
jgi:hypothetical protein